VVAQNFGIVEEDLYRAGQPNELNFPFMEKLHLKKVIWLAPEEPVRELYVRPHLYRLRIRFVGHISMHAHAFPG
jgi:protein tyrosine/serine phosphatase